MNKLYALVFMLAALPSFSQIINFPDPGFKYWAVAYADQNQDNEVSQEEALFCSMLYLDGPEITSLEGIQYFSQLTDLSITNTSVTSINFQTNAAYWITIDDNPLLTTLVLGGSTQTFNDPSLECHNNPNLQSVDVSNFHNLLGLNISGNPSLQNLSLNPEARELNAQDNALTTIDFSSAFLYRCDVSNNQFTNLNIPAMDGFPDIGLNTLYLNISGNSFTTIQLPHIDYGTLDVNGGNFFTLGTISISHTQLETLSFTELMILNYLIIEDNANLQYISFRNGYPDVPMVSQGSIDPYISNIQYANNPQVSYICVDEIERRQNIFESEITEGIAAMESLINDPEIVVSYYCTPAPGGDFFVANGTVRYDANGDGCSDSDAPLSGLNITASNYFTTSDTDANGNFTAFATLANPNLTVNVPTNPYFTVTPSSYSYNFNSNPVAEPEFCISPNGSHTDLAISIIPLQQARVGFPVSYKVICRNVGTTSLQGYVALNYESDRMFTSSVTPLDQNNPGVLAWFTPPLPPFGSFENTVVFTLNGPMDSPSVNLGDVTHMSGGVFIGGDENLTDNDAVVNQTTIGAYDPNDKAVNEGTEVSLAEAADGFTYTVRFQNNGTAPAEKVVIEDMIDPDLDLSTLHIVGSSHVYTLQIIDRKLVAFFENIGLPAAQDDEPGSHGYISYHIKPTSAIAVGSEFNNTASIFFDFNFPIITNEVVTEVVVLGTTDNTPVQTVKIFPNPAKNQLAVVSDTELTSVKIYSLTGQELMRTDKSREHQIDISILSAGTYLVEIHSDAGKTIKKLIKL